MWTGDNLPIMRGMNSESVDLIYLDPPFNSKANYAAPIGSKAAGAAFKDTWTLSDVDAEWVNLMEAKHPALHRVLLAAMTPSDKSYLAYMAVRLLEMRRLLKPTGSIYLHCDPTMGAYLKLLLDSVFGRKAFRNEIVWSYQRWTGATRHFQRMHDTVWFYAMERAGFNMLKEAYSAKSKHKGARRTVFVGGQIEQSYTGDTSRQKAMRDVWEISYLNSQAKERTGYPTQKPLALLRRIVEASSNPGDMLLDPFAGCATACIAAEQLDRQWVGIDISEKAAELVKRRMDAELGLFYKGAHRTDIPKRTDLGKLAPYNSASNKRNLYGQQEGQCAGCDTHFEARNLEVDHIIARVKGGTDHLENLQLLCGSCNRIKGDRGMEYLQVKLQLKGF
ncbi:MAG: DNA methyltransferase [Rhodobacteraceae bacterium]|nr:DNA methyltransferase [Paracoccaceae bacterium]